MLLDIDKKIFILRFNIFASKDDSSLVEMGLSSVEHWIHMSVEQYFDKIFLVFFLLCLEDLSDHCCLYIDLYPQAQMPRLVQHSVGSAISN